MNKLPFPEGSVVLDYYLSPTLNVYLWYTPKDPVTMFIRMYWQDRWWHKRDREQIQFRGTWADYCRMAGSLEGVWINSPRSKRWFDSWLMEWLL